jgi:alkylated DNA nucleotide flippase Atl1
MLSIKAQIIEIVNQIPVGKVMYFGQIGKLIVNQKQSSHIEQAKIRLGFLEHDVVAASQKSSLDQDSVDFAGVSGQVVGFMLSGLPQDQWNLLPWHRVVAKDGYISSLKLGAKGLIQKQLLLGENVSIAEDRVDMAKHLFEANQPEVLF